MSGKTFNLDLESENTVFGMDSRSLTSWAAPIKVDSKKKLDIFAFGLILLELISGHEIEDGELSRY